jgi:RimJ/RimL family protein N-acetyltransferase
MASHRIGPETERLRLRAFTIDDAEAFHALNGHPEVMLHTGEPLLASVEEARAAILAYRDFEDPGFGRWACIAKETGRIVGFCGLKRLPELDEVDLGYRFLPGYWGRGLATEACRASLRFGFDVLGLDRIIALVLPENHASIRVLEKVGMRRDGELRYEGLLALRYLAERGGGL